MQRNQHILIRPADKGDHNFLFSSYLNNNWYSKEQATTLRKSQWMALQHKRLEKVLESGVVKVACIKDDPDVILGYAFPDGEKPFSYVKLSWRDNQNLKSEQNPHIQERLLSALKDTI